MSSVPDHKWWCYGEHIMAVKHRGDTCYGWYDLNHPLEMVMAAPIAMPSASKADLDAAAMLLGYHPTHTTAVGTPFCNACATNLATHSDLAMERCPKALPPAGTVIPGHIVLTGGPRHWSIQGTEGRVWDVEERFAQKDGKRYLYCPCPSWKFHGQTCKHTIRAAQEM